MTTYIRLNGFFIRKNRSRLDGSVFFSVNYYYGTCMSFDTLPEVLDYCDA